MNHCRSKKWYKWYCSRHVWFPEEITLRSVSSGKCFITLWFIQHMEFFGTKSPCIDCGLATTCYYCNKNALTDAWIQFCFLGLSENLEEHPQSWWFKSDFPHENGHILKIWELPNGRTHLVLLVSQSHSIPSSKRLHNYGTSPFLMGKSTISTRPWLPVRFLFSRLPGRLTSHERSPLVDTGPTRAFPSGNRPLHGGLHSSLPGLCVPQRTIKFHSTAMTKGQLTRHSVNQASRIQYCHSIIDMIIEWSSDFPVSVQFSLTSVEYPLVNSHNYGWNNTTFQRSIKAIIVTYSP